MDLKILAEIARDSGEATNCFIKDLGSLDCRRGCSVCSLDELMVKMRNGFMNFEEGPGTLSNV